MDDSDTLLCRESLSSMSSSSFASSEEEEEEGGAASINAYDHPITEIEEEEEAVSINAYDQPITEIEDEYIETLVKKELSSGIKNDDGSSSGALSMMKMNDSLKRVRLVAVNSIMERKDSGGFRSQTAYLAVIYLDRYMSNRQIENWKPSFIELVALVCFGIAVKMEERSFPSSDRYRSRNYSFGRKLVRGMESAVLIRLEWRMKSVTPFDYLHYFIAKLSDESRPQDLASRAVELILTATRENNSLDHRSYAIAAAAILVALDRNLTKDQVGNKLSLLSSSVHADLEHVFSCYNMMRELEVENLKELPIDTGVADLVDDSATLPGSTKRRLVYK